MAISCFYLYRIEALFYAIGLISKKLAGEEITGQRDVHMAIDSIYELACQGSEFSLEVANRLDLAEMTSRDVKEA